MKLIYRILFRINETGKHGVLSFEQPTLGDAINEFDGTINDSGEYTIIQTEEIVIDSNIPTETTY